MGDIGERKPKVVIVGAGMAGLAAAHRLQSCSGDILDLVVVEAGDRIGGRIFTSEFSGSRIEMGATWIHGIDGSPVYDMAKKAGALIPDDHGGFPFPFERMDGLRSEPLTVAEGGRVVDASMISRISALFSHLKDLIASGEAGDDSPSVGAFLRRGFQSYLASREIGADWTEAAAFAMYEYGERTYTAVDDLESLDLAAEKEYKEFPGEHITLPGGYSRIPNFLSSRLPAGAIRFGRNVSLIEWRPAGSAGIDPVRIHFEDGGMEYADHAIVTVSLGVLKAGLNVTVDGAPGLAFSPPLPEKKREAIRRLGFGLVNKLFMELKGGGENDRSPFPSLRMAFDPARHVASIPRWIRRTESIFPIHSGSRVLLAWFVGGEAAEIEKMDDDEIIRGIHATLDGFSPPPRAAAAADAAFGKIARIRRSGWGRDPRFLGSYSYVAVGSSGDDQDELAKPLPEGGISPAPLQILFAGEATHRTRYATTHGAFLSGVREADRLIQHYGLRSCGF
ncbi:putative polyamine oxidase 5 [Apostasia shenzhenica]|uniref:Putative polyamine oxidase 5 n=1 Tax=Apostasia shenzhenica TaxID=1088818 RepID=A0A2I0ATX5_9ASPA|nr:putative polyamine oxidase 5 [Apostasia shenzhenica]